MKSVMAALMMLVLLSVTMLAVKRVSNCKHTEHAKACKQELYNKATPSATLPTG
ncbi:MAG: hypothetical protein LPJ89_04660 [Hymenobacteraceae bacterium]|nr:hypothetical protein [Hymenobacteraceae bacterium]